jgi:hypothetical protein
MGQFKLPFIRAYLDNLEDYFISLGYNWRWSLLSTPPSQKKECNSSFDQSQTILSLIKSTKILST